MIKIYISLIIVLCVSLCYAGPREDRFVSEMKDNEIRCARLLKIEQDNVSPVNEFKNTDLSFLSGLLGKDVSVLFKYRAVVKRLKVMLSKAEYRSLLNSENCVPLYVKYGYVVGECRSFEWRNVTVVVYDMNNDLFHVGVIKDSWLDGAQTGRAFPDPKKARIVSEDYSNIPVIIESWRYSCL
jgi:hypothetical protein